MWSMCFTSNPLYIVVLSIITLYYKCVLGFYRVSDLDRIWLGFEFWIAVQLKLNSNLNPNYYILRLKFKFLFKSKYKIWVSINSKFKF